MSIISGRHLKSDGTDSRISGVRKEDTKPGDHGTEVSGVWLYDFAEREQYGTRMSASRRKCAVA